MRYYTGIGSRDTPAPCLKIMEDIAEIFADHGWTGRSGGAKGADSAFERGADKANGLFVSYLPWTGFKSEVTRYTVTATDLHKYQEAKNIASKVHPAWNKCSQGARMLHTRNVFQVLGDDLQTPSKVLICYAPPDGQGGVRGGTRTAVEIAKSHGIPIVNLALAKDMLQLDKLKEEVVYW